MASKVNEEIVATTEEMRMARIIRSTMLDEMMITKLAGKLEPYIDSAIQNGIAEIKNTQHQMKAELSEMKIKLEIQEEKLNGKDHQIKVLENEIEKHRKETSQRIEELSTGKTKTPAATSEVINKTIESQMEKLIKTQERDLQRYKNIIIHGAQETKEENIHRRITNEIETITNILKSLEVTTTVTGHSRLGRFDEESDRPRLMRVSLQNETDRNEILKKNPENLPLSSLHQIDLMKKE